MSSYFMEWRIRKNIRKKFFQRWFIVIKMEVYSIVRLAISMLSMSFANHRGGLHLHQSILGALTRQKRLVVELSANVFKKIHEGIGTMQNEVLDVNVLF